MVPPWFERNARSLLLSTLCHDGGSSPTRNFGVFVVVAHAASATQLATNTRCTCDYVPRRVPGGSAGHSGAGVLWPWRSCEREANRRAGFTASGPIRRTAPWSGRCRGRPLMKLDGRLIVLTNREPFAIVERDGKRLVERPAGGLIAALEPAMRSTRGVWISSDQQQAADDPDIQAQIAAMEYSWKPVSIPPDRYERYYLGTSNKALWPLYHSRPGTAVYLRNEWEDYRGVNEQFAEITHGILAQDDVVWIHDYQLSLVPAALRRRGLPSGLRIGFLLH